MWVPTISQLAGAVIAPPLIAGTIGLLTGDSLAERHHLHHDTYVVSMVASRTMMLVMAFMAVLGCLTGWLCHLGVFSADPRVPLCFFIAFEMTMLLSVIALVRFRVMSYDDHLVVRLPFGLTRVVPYERIERMSWQSFFLNDEIRDLVITFDGGNRLRIWGLLDVEQMLLRINRFDVLEG